MPPFATLEDTKKWAAELAPLNSQRIKIIQDLLRNANGDGMCEADRAECRKALELLTAQQIPERVPPVTLTIDPSETEEVH